MGCVCLLGMSGRMLAEWNLEVTISTKQKYKAPEDYEHSPLSPKIPIIGTQ